MPALIWLLPLLWLEDGMWGNGMCQITEDTLLKYFLLSAEISPINCGRHCLQKRGALATTLGAYCVAFVPCAMSIVAERR